MSGEGLGGLKPAATQPSVRDYVAAVYGEQQIPARRAGLTAIRQKLAAGFGMTPRGNWECNH